LKLSIRRAKCSAQEWLTTAASRGHCHPAKHENLKVAISKLFNNFQDDTDGKTGLMQTLKVKMKVIISLLLILIRNPMKT